MDINGDINNNEYGLTNDEVSDLQQDIESERCDDIEKENLDKFAEFYDKHGYGPEDYNKYSQDPEWRALMSEGFPDYELPPLDDNNSKIDFDEIETEFSSVNEYYGAHGYGPEDYDEYSQDPEWQALVKKEFPDCELPSKK